MANDKISDIANTVACGDNSVESIIAGEASLKAGMGVYSYENATGVKAIEGDECISRGVRGIIKEHYATGMDIALADEASLEMVTKGIVPIFCDDPGVYRPEGGLLNASGAIAGSFGWSEPLLISLSGYMPVLKTIKPTANGATVTMARFI